MATKTTYRSSSTAMATKTTIVSDVAKAASAAAPSNSRCGCCGESLLAAAAADDLAAVPDQVDGGNAGGTVVGSTCGHSYHYSCLLKLLYIQDRGGGGGDHRRPLLCPVPKCRAAIVDVVVCHPAIECVGEEAGGATNAAGDLKNPTPLSSETKKKEKEAIHPFGTRSNRRVRIAAPSNDGASMKTPCRAAKAAAVAREGGVRQPDETDFLIQKLKIIRMIDTPPEIKEAALREGRSLGSPSFARLFSPSSPATRAMTTTRTTTPGTPNSGYDGDTSFMSIVGGSGTPSRCASPAKTAPFFVHLFSPSSASRSGSGKGNASCMSISATPLAEGEASPHSRWSPAAKQWLRRVVNILSPRTAKKAPPAGNEENAGENCFISPSRPSRTRLFDDEKRLQPTAGGGKSSGNGNGSGNGGAVSARPAAPDTVFI